MQIRQVINSTTKEGLKTPLHCIAYTGGPSAPTIAAQLITAGSDTNALDSQGETPLLLATRRTTTIDLIAVLLHAGTDSNIVNKEGVCALQIASSGGNATIIRMLLDVGAQVVNPNSKPSSFPPLLAAARNGHTDACRMLINAGVPLDCTNASGHTSLHVAAFGGHLSIVSLLLELGADVNACDNTHQTALTMATLKGATAIVKALLQVGANPNVATSKANCTPLHIAARDGHYDVLCLLASSRGINLNVVDEQNRTPLHWTCFRGDMKSTLILLEHDADPMIRDKHGHSAVEVAIAKQFAEIVEVLVARIGTCFVTCW